MLDLNFESSEKVRSVWSSTAITRFDISLPYVQIDTWIDFDLPNPIYMFFDSFLMTVIAMVRINLPSIQTIATVPIVRIVQLCVRG